MTIESDFFDIKDPERFAASIRVRPPGLKDVLSSVVEKVSKEWNENHEEIGILTALKIWLKENETI